MKSTDTMTEDNNKTDLPTNQKRRYNSPRRRQQRANTRQNIIEAGARLAQESSTWNWKNLTFKEVSEKAGVSERTVYRYFATERKLRDAVIGHMVSESGVDLDRLKLSNFRELTTRMFNSLSAFARPDEPEMDPTFSSLDQQRREALITAVMEKTSEWPEREGMMVAAALDLLWNPATYDRLVLKWGFDTDQAAQTIGWMIDMVEDAVINGRKPK